MVVENENTYEINRAGYKTDQNNGKMQKPLIWAYKMIQKVYKETVVNWICFIRYHVQDLHTVCATFYSCDFSNLPFFLAEFVLGPGGQIHVSIFCHQSYLYGWLSPLYEIHWYTFFAAQLSCHMSCAHIHNSLMIRCGLLLTGTDPTSGLGHR